MVFRLKPSTGGPFFLLLSEQKLTHFILIPSLVVALGISLVLLGRSVWRVILGANPQSALEKLFGVLLVGAASVIAIDWIQESRALTSRHYELYSDFACLLVFSAFILYAYRVNAFRGQAAMIRRSVHSWAMILIAMGMTGWSYHRVSVRSMNFNLVGLEDVLPGAVQVNSLALGVTDDGTVVPLYGLSASEEMFEEYLLSSEEKFKSFNHVGIHREQADRMSNCHGWVFTNGQFLLKGRDVDRILCDNRYVVVVDPQPDDVVIYRDDLGRILHTALVQGVLRDGTIITESKWGIDQRFLHLPVDQPYSQTFQYYRTKRPNHLIKIIDAKDFDSSEEVGVWQDG